MPLNILRQYFGYDYFRDGQDVLVDALIENRDVLGIMPTGAGKSICFQVPALMKDGITLVISPLISLMQDQVKSLIATGVAAAYINSSLSPRQVSLALSNAKVGKYKIIYVAPERLLTDEFLDFAQSADISMLAVDEAHCISQWGQDFRPSYAQIPSFISSLPSRPTISAFTATATTQVKSDILRILALEKPLVVVTGFDRPNLYFEVRQTKDKLKELISFISQHENQSGIVYCATRKTVETVCEQLQERNFLSSRYHAGLTSIERAENQNQFLYDEIKIMVATNAFGMGIDKSNVSFVVHYNMPKDIESYYQEAGRAGRDGAPAQCLLLYSSADVTTHQYLIENSRENTYESYEMEQMLKSREYKRLAEITDMCTGTDCLRNCVLQYFGEEPAGNCNNCSNCNADFDEIDVSLQAQKIVACIASLYTNFGKRMIIDVLRGSQNARIKSLNLNRLHTFGTEKSDADRLRVIMDKLIATGFLNISEGEYPVVSLSENSALVLRGEHRVIIKVISKKELPKKAKAMAYSEDLDGREEIVEKLRRLRTKLSKQENIPAYMVFSDATLLDMCKKLPRDDNAFLEVSGVGRKKLEKYGSVFIAEIDKYCRERL